MLSWDRISIVLAAVWLIFTGTLIVWWMYFAFSLIGPSDENRAGHRTMLLWEGGTLLVLLVAGGLCLIYFIVREKNRSQNLKTFFASVTHDLKTSLTGVRLLTESLRDDMRSLTPSNEGLVNLAERLLTDTSRLQIQLENILYLGGPEKAGLYIEEIPIHDLLELVKESWPQLDVHVSGKAKVKADRRALENVIHNIFHNALMHGQAKIMNVDIKTLDSNKIQIDFVDDGRGFSGDLKSLGKMFYRHNPSSGSGLGLFTARSYVEKMNGRIVFSQTNRNFRVTVEIPGRLV